MRIPAIFFLTLVISSAFAQRFAPLQPPNSYRNADNPLYWKNRPPYPGYWQQDVHYLIKARLNDMDDVINGDLTLYYHNNSPDTLHYVYFHLYQEAYVKGSYLENKSIAEGEDKKYYSTLPYGGTRVHAITSNGDTLRSEQDNTVLKVWLKAPLSPSERITLRMDFATHWSTAIDRRMKLFNAWGQKHYDGVHWYPRIAVYDRKFGWDTQQHLGSEFYGDFGTFDVELDFPNQYIMDATGWLQNEREVLPAELKAKLALSNFKDKPWNERPSVVIVPDTSIRKVWKFHAENVHDFAFTADPTYRIGEATWNGVKCVALAQEPHASGWQNAAEYTAKIIECFSRDFGMYAYPKMIVADARDGMEYPMLTLDSGNEPNYRGLFVHEIGHNWFFGMLGSNETYRAFMDEGFTQFLTIWGLEQIDGDTMVETPAKNFYERGFTQPSLAREEPVYYSYQYDALRNEIPPINVHSDEFGHVEGLGRGYGHVYDKTAVMLYNLQYVLGDSLFLAAMQNYVQQWKICHPYPEDMRQSFIDFTHADLNWFFDQWIETDRRIDYSIRSVKRKNRSEGQEIRLLRKGDLHMPIDLRITANNGKKYDYYIPNTWFEKKTDATVLPRWIGYDELARDYTARVDIPTGIANVQIDTTGRLGDVYLLNNSMHVPVNIMFDHHIRNRPDRHAYQVFARPDLWWNGYDGIKAGVHLNSSYMKYKHQIHFSAWLNTGIGQYLSPDNPVFTDAFPGNKDVAFDPLSFVFSYENGTEKLLKGSSVSLKARHLDGLELYGGGAKWKAPKGGFDVEADLRYFVRKDSADLTYLLYPKEWTLNKWQGVLDLYANKKYQLLGGTGKLQLRLRQPMVGSTGFGENVRLTTWNEFDLGKAELKVRLIAQYGTGTGGIETAFYMAGGAPENLMENKYVRSAGLVPYDWVGAYGNNVNHFHYGGGLNLRGYAGYLAPELTPDSTVVYTYRGNTGVAANAELDLDKFLRIKPRWTKRWLHLDAYLFGDIGSMGYRDARNGKQQLEMAMPRADAGAGFALTIKKFGPLVDIKPFTIRFDMPLFLSALPANETEHFAFRYVVGIGRSF
ncbi:MAG: M1 family metallopeptidase [Flavobacteriales bacterium]|nr:M1 family metallopeptidase [Flavobacteriales bacterium]MBK6946395.1 M1 family metallopeptidase [Flavobacteriales bacterium]MBK9536444.1 M1 family metallopeptidase [Flavobacteriales bacterium]MBP9137347.1 M1 family metallopeptidase [Flavobacteriales bacterium]HQV50691.1 M1 family metallopeptidase [Flavobacteriales bacterium]